MTFLLRHNFGVNPGHETTLVYLDGAKIMLYSCASDWLGGQFFCSSGVKRDSVSQPHHPPVFQRENPKIPPWPSWVFLTPAITCHPSWTGCRIPRMRPFSRSHREMQHLGPVGTDIKITRRTGFMSKNNIKHLMFLSESDNIHQVLIKKRYCK